MTTTPPQTVTVTAQPPAPAPTDRDAAFIALVAPNLPAGLSDRLPQVAQDVCSDVGGGKLAGQVTQTTYENTKAKYGKTIRYRSDVCWLVRQIRCCTVPFERDVQDRNW